MQGKNRKKRKKNLSFIFVFKKHDFAAQPFERELRLKFYALIPTTAIQI